MRVRKLDVNGDVAFGNGFADFEINTPMAVGLLCQYRLHLNLGEFFLDVTDGTPYQTKVFGYGTQATRDPAYQQRILQTPGVGQIAAYDSIATTSRQFDVKVTITTTYGTTPFTVGALT